ncbi:MAG TPA: hypothetical protein VMD30_12720 [Tepidisphaeraceae bacterium]|nr:hypothetical protein [Tepidisphaeraceae bacterium]
MTTTCRRWVVGLGFIAAIAFAVSPSLARKKGGGGGGSRNSAPQQQAQNPNEVALQSAETDLATANAKLKQVIADLWAKFTADPAWAAAEKAVADAQTAYDAACRGVQNSLMSNPDYKAASDSSDSIDAKIETARDNGDQDTVIQLAQEKLQDATTLTKMQTDAMNADPTVASTKQALTAAKAVEDQLRQKFQDSLAADDDYKAAKQAVDDATTKLASLRGTSGTTGTATAGGSGSSTPNANSAGDGASSVPDPSSTVEGITGE